MLQKIESPPLMRRAPKPAVKAGAKDSTNHKRRHRAGQAEYADSRSDSHDSEMVYRGRQHVGYLVHRQRHQVEALDVDAELIGSFPSHREAFTAVIAGSRP